MPPTCDGSENPPLDYIQRIAALEAKLTAPFDPKVLSVDELRRQIEALPGVVAVASKTLGGWEEVGTATGGRFERRALCGTAVAKLSWSTEKKMWTLWVTMDCPPGGPVAPEVWRVLIARPDDVNEETAEEVKTFADLILINAGFRLEQRDVSP